jgi:flagellar protein FliS
MNAMELAYRKSAAEGANGLGIMIALYDTLAGNLRRATDAERANDIQTRCDEVNHALLVIAHLEDSLGLGSGGKLADQLKAFYAKLRRNLIKAQAVRSAALLEQQMLMVLDLRRTWQEVEARKDTTAESTQIRPTCYTVDFPGGTMAYSENRAFSCSA